MAAGNAQERTVSVRLRSLLSRPRTKTVRRLLAVGGLAAVGWMLGSAGQVHADTVPDPTRAVPCHAANGAVPAGVARLGGAGEQSVHRLPAKGSSAFLAPPAQSGVRTAESVMDGMRPGSWASGSSENGVHDVIDTAGAGVGRAAGVVSAPAVPEGIGNLPVGKAVTVAPADTRGQAFGSEIRHREGAMPESSGRVGGRTGPRIGKAGRRAHAARRTAGSVHVLAPIPPRPQNPMNSQAGALPVPSGPAHPSGGFGGLPMVGTEAYARPTHVLAPALGAVPPAVHNVATEPALSPD